jgi:hypothetical protein
MEIESPNFDSFNLNLEKPVFTENDDELIDDEDYFQEIRNEFIKYLPQNAFHLGTIDLVMDGSCISWNITDDYYLIKLENEAYDWALIRISWDDNWSQWNWCYDARIKGFQDEPSEAAKIILISLWELWELDLNDPDYDSYKAFFMHLK